MIHILGSTPLTQILGAPGDNTNHEAMRAYIKALCSHGLSVLLIMPNSKRPFDGRTLRQRRAADKVAQTEAQAAGRRDWIKAKSPGGLALATADSKVILKKGGYLDEYIRVFSTWHSAEDVNVQVEPTQKQINDGEAVMLEPCPINLAIEVGESGLIVVDADTTAQRESFLEISGAPEDLPPTVITPGTRKDDIEVHYDGGHFYFTVSDEDRLRLPRNMGSMTWGGVDGFAVLWDRRYVLIPPSTRAEGAYELVGRDYEAPEWLVQAIIDKGEARAGKFHDNNVAPTDDLGVAINEWAEGVSWASILEPLGWTPTVRPDNCGCEVWTAPGEHSSPKSATAHDAGCGLGRYTETNAPLHFWTDNPGEPFASYIAESGGSTTMSKLQAVAWSDYEGSVGAAMDALGLGDDTATLDRELGLQPKSVEAELGVDQSNLSQDIEIDMAPPQNPFLAAKKTVAKIDHLVETEDADEEQARLVYESEQESAAEEADGKKVSAKVRQENFSSTSDDEPETPPENPFAVGDDEDGPEPAVFESSVPGVPIFAPFSYWRDMPPPEYIIEGLIEHGGLSCIIGPPGIGKSSVVLDMACCIAVGRPWQGRKTLQTRVMYLPGEGLSGAVQRIKAWAHEHDIPHELIDQNLILANDIIKISASTEAWGEVCKYALQMGVGVIIFDTYARMSTGVDENSATEVGRAIARLDQVRKITSAGAVLIHHTAKHNPRSGRGSSALNGALDSEILVSEGHWDWAENGYSDDDVESGNLPKGKPLEVDTTKQKNAEQLENPIPLLMRSCEAFDAPYITGPNGSVDPMLGGLVTTARPRPEPTLETAIRIRVHLDEFTSTSLTKAEITAGVRPDRHTATRKDAVKAWKQQVMRALDMGLHYGLLDHPYGTGETSGKMISRYIAGKTSVEDARSRHAAEILSDGDGD